VIDEFGLDPTFVCDTDEQRSNLVSLGVQPSAIKVTGNAVGNITGVSLAREWVITNVMPVNQWSLWLDDNVQEITGIPYQMAGSETIDLKDGNDWRTLFDLHVGKDDFFQYVGETIEHADKHGTIFAAFANENNFFFRIRKWLYYGYCRTQCGLYKNDGSTWFPFKTMMLEDGFKSIDVVARYGKIVINRYIKAIKPQFETGGIGSFMERLPHLQDNCLRLAGMYPGLVETCGDGTQYGAADATDFNIKFKLRSTNTVNNWRRKNGYLPC
jgi:hypothetical protein